MKSVLVFFISNTLSACFFLILKIKLVIHLPLGSSLKRSSTKSSAPPDLWIVGCIGGALTNHIKENGLIFLVLQSEEVPECRVT